MQARIGIVTDSTAYLPPEVVERYGIRVVPLIVRFGEDAYAEGVEIENSTFYRRFRQEKTLPKTSQPAVGEFVAAYQQLLAEKEGVVSVHISGGLSGTVDAARAAARVLGEERIAIVDSRISAMALGFMAWEAAELAEQGRGMEEIVARVEEIKREMKAYFMVDNLEYLARGGRLSGMAAALGSLLQIKPILHLVDGRIELLEKNRTRKRTLERILEFCRQESPPGRRMRATIIHGDDLPAAEEFRSQVEAAVPGTEILISEFGPVIGTYLGPGALGLAYYPLARE